MTERTLARSSRIEIGVEHHPQRGGHQRHRPRPVLADRVGPPSTSNRSSSTNGRASAMHSSTRNTPPTCTSGELTIATPVRSPVGAATGPVSAPITLRASMS